MEKRPTIKEFTNYSDLGVALQDWAIKKEREDEKWFAEAESLVDDLLKRLEWQIDRAVKAEFKIMELKRILGL